MVGAQPQREREKQRRLSTGTKNRLHISKFSYKRVAYIRVLPYLLLSVDAQMLLAFFVFVFFFFHEYVTMELPLYFRLIKVLLTELN